LLLLILLLLLCNQLIVINGILEWSSHTNLSLEFN